MGLSDIIGDAHTVLYGDFYANLRLINVPNLDSPSPITTTIVESDNYVLESIGQGNPNEGPKFIFPEDKSIPQISSFDQPKFLNPSPVHPTSSYYEAYRRLYRFDSSNDSPDPLLYPEHSFRLANPSRDDVLAYSSTLNLISSSSVNSIQSDLSNDDNNNGLQEELSEEPKPVAEKSNPLKPKRMRRKIKESMPKPSGRKDSNKDNGLQTLSEEPKPVEEKLNSLKLKSKKRKLQEASPSPHQRKVLAKNQYIFRCPLVICECKFSTNVHLMAHLRMKHPEVSMGNILNINRKADKENMPSMKNKVSNVKKVQSEKRYILRSRNKSNQKSLNNTVLNTSVNIQKTPGNDVSSKVDHQSPKLINPKTSNNETPQITQPQEKRKIGRPKGSRSILNCN